MIEDMKKTAPQDANAPMADDMDNDSDEMSYPIPDGVTVNEGEEVSLPAEVKFLAKDGKLWVKGVNSIDGNKVGEQSMDDQREGFRKRAQAGEDLYDSDQVGG